MNDAMEGEWLRHIVETKIEDGEWWQWKEAGHVFSDYKIFKRNFYIACFSECGDLLSQWRAYGDDGRGLCVGFNFDGSSIPTGLTFTNVFHLKALLCTLDKVLYE